MKDLLISTLEPMGYPIFLQGSMAQDDVYPESFFTFWNNSTDDGNYYDNEPIDFIWSFDVNFYSSDPSLVNSELYEARRLLKDAGFIVIGKGYDVGSDEPTHTGRGMEVLAIERIKED